VRDLRLTIDCGRERLALELLVRLHCPQAFSGKFKPGVVAASVLLRLHRIQTRTAAPIAVAAK